MPLPHFPASGGFSFTMKPHFRIGILLLLCAALLLAACGAGGGPAIDGTRSWFQALADLNVDQVMKLTCSNPQVRSEIEQRLEPFVDIKDSLDALKGQFDFSGLKFEEKSNDGRTATIRLSGKMFLKALGQSQPLSLYEDISVVNEGGVWKVCTNPLQGQ
jgi:hypothetical protein